MPGKELTVEALLKGSREDMELELVAGEGGLKNVIRTAEITRPGLAFAGFFDVFSHDRVQIIGNTEMSYIQSLPPQERCERFRRILEYEIPCFIITNGNMIPNELISQADAHQVPLLTTRLPTTRLVSLLNAFLERYFAPEAEVHGELVDVYGMGTLLMGQSGVGKSECALELVERGHRLVADDVVILRRLSRYDIIGYSPNIIKYHMEIRGIGILNVEKLFGAASVVEEKRVDLVVLLEPWQDGKEYERLGIETEYHTFFDVKIPKYVIPVQPGRNISIIVEMAALTQRLKNSGINPALLMEQKLREATGGPAAYGRNFGISQ
ncbi:MAG: HPr(Ser) kinase/phosphatase [Candidatus Sumerlaeaceae bacterium]|nr:HPr(Ser) kinase/phosphatase [Candidatus Sumerlaeaceae bacterium]